MEDFPKARRILLSKGAVAMEFIVSLPVFMAFAVGVVELSETVMRSLGDIAEARSAMLAIASQASQNAFSRDEEGFLGLRRIVETHAYVRVLDLE